MPDRPSQSIPKWLSHLDSLLQEYARLEEHAWRRDPKSAYAVGFQPARWMTGQFNRLFRKAGCLPGGTIGTGYQIEATPAELSTQYAVSVSAKLPPLEQETRALHAVLEGLNQPFDCPSFVTQEEQRAIRKLRRLAVRTAEDRLRELKDGPMPDGPAPPCFFWWQDECHRMAPRLWAMLNSLWDKEAPEVQEVARQVWANEGLEVGQNTIHATLSKLNAFLAGLPVPVPWTYRIKAGRFLKN